MRTIALVGLLLLSSGARSQAPDSESKVAARFDAVVVTGEQPGPQLWKLTRDGHVLWVLGTVTPKPRDITWRSKQVAKVLDDTQLVIDQQLQASSLPTNVAIEIDSHAPFKGIRAARLASKVREENPPPPLREVLSPELYERFAKLAKRYLPKDKTIENVRPRVAANRLYNAAIDVAGLTTRAMIHEEVHKLARNRRVKVTEITRTFKFDVETYIEVNNEFVSIPPANEIPCFLETIEQLEAQLPTITVRANAWATGDVAELRALPLLRQGPCDAVYWSAPRWANLRTELESLWTDTVEAATQKHKATLVLLDMAEILDPKGLMPTLAKRGFAVEGP